MRPYRARRTIGLDRPTEASGLDLLVGVNQAVKQVAHGLPIGGPQPPKVTEPLPFDARNVLHDADGYEVFQLLAHQIVWDS